MNLPQRRRHLFIWTILGLLLLATVSLAVLTAPFFAPGAPASSPQ